MALPIADHQMNCDMCSRKLKGIFKTEAYECQRCQYKVHKNHVEQEERNLTACQSGVRALLLLADDPKTKQTWVERLNRYVPVSSVQINQFKSLLLAEIINFKESGICKFTLIIDRTRLIT